MVAELGPDMQVFPDARHAASWAGICPGNRESGGKRLNGRTRKANPYLRRVLCQAAWGASHAKDTYLSALYRRQRGRLGHNQAILALAHQLLLIAYTMLRRGEDYQEFGGDYFDRKNKPKVVNRLVERLTELDFYVTLQQAPGTIPDDEPSAPEAAADLPPAALPTLAAPLDAVSSPAKRKRGRPCKCASRGLLCRHRSATRTQPPDFISMNAP